MELQKFTKEELIKSLIDNACASAVMALECLPEDTQIEGNAMASGNKADDEAVENWIKDQLNSGNEWAWCSVKISYKIPGTEFEGTDYLGCCSYRSREDFVKAGDYYDQMCDQARADLRKNLEDFFARLAGA